MKDAAQSVEKSEGREEETMEHSTSPPTPTSTLAEKMSAELDALPRPYFDPSFDAVGHELALLSPPSPSPSQAGEREECAGKRKEENLVVPSFDALEALAGRRTLALEAASDRLRAALKRDSVAALEGLEGVVSVAGEVGSAARAAASYARLTRVTASIAMPSASSSGSTSVAPSVIMSSSESR